MKPRLKIDSEGKWFYIINVRSEYIMSVIVGPYNDIYSAYMDSLKSQILPIRSAH
jgi:hypothetical protein